MAKVLAVLALLAGGLREDVDNPEYKMWSKFKAGASVKFKMISEAAGTKTESEMSHKLVELTADKAVVESAMVFGGNALPGQKREIPSKVKKIEGQAGDAPKPKEGEEELEVAGKKLKTKWVETTVEAGGNKTVSKMWQSDEIPGGMAKMESATAGQISSKTTMIVAEYKKE